MKNTKKTKVKKSNYKNNYKKKKIIHSRHSNLAFLVLALIIIAAGILSFANLVAGASSTPTKDTVATVQQKSSVTSVSWSHTVGNFTNRVLVVGVAVNGGKSVSSVTYGSQSLARVDAVSYGTGTQDDEMWYLVNPTVGTGTITLKLSAAANIVADSVSYYNVNQSTPFGVDTKASGKGTTATVSVASGSNEVVLDVLGSDTINGNFQPASGQTSLWNGFSNTPQSGASIKSSSGASTTITWTNRKSDNWADIGVALLPITVVPTPTPTIAPTATPTPTVTTSLSQTPSAVPSSGAGGGSGVGLSVNGVSLVKGNTRFILKGVNLEYYRDSGNPGFMSSEVPLASQIVAKMKSLGINAVRLDYTPSYVNQGSNMTNYLAMVKLLASNGIYVMPSDHSYTGNPISGYTTTSFPDFKTIITYAQQQGITNYLIMNPYNEPYSSDDSKDWIAANEATLQYFRTTLGFKGVVVLDTTAWATTDNTASFQTMMSYDASLLGGKSNIVFSNHWYPTYSYQSTLTLAKQYPLVIGEIGQTISGPTNPSYVTQVFQGLIATGIPNGHNGAFPWIWWWTDGNQMTNDGLTLNTFGQLLVTDFYSKVTEPSN